MPSSRRIVLLLLALVLLVAASVVVIGWALSHKTTVAQRVPTANEEKVTGPGRVRGTVYEARRELAVARATISAYGQSQTVVTASNEDGSFEFATNDNFVEVVAEAPGLRNAGAQDRGIRLRIDPDSLTDGLRIFLYEPCEVVGGVFGDGRPVEAEVVAHFKQDASGANDYDAALAATDFDGSFKLGGLPPGLLEVRINADGFAPFVTDGVELGPGDILSLGDIQLARGGTLRGRVLSEEGVPLAGASVAAGSARTWLRQQTAEDGSFRIYGVPAGLIGLELRATGYAMSKRSLRLEANAEEYVEVQMQALRGISVRVQERDGTPVQGARVEIGVDGSAQVLRSLVYEGVELRIDDLEGQQFWVRAVHPSFPSSASTTVAVGELAQLVLTAGSELTGIVLTATGSVAEMAQLRLIDSNTGRPVTGWTATAQGRFVYQGLSGGWYQLEGSGQGHRVSRGEPFEVREGENTSQSLRLRRGGVLVGVVSDARSGAPIAGARVGMEGFAHAVLTEVDGSYVLSAFPEGRASVEVRAKGYRSALASGLIVGDDQRGTRDFRLEPGESASELELVGIGIQVQESAGRIVVRQPVEGASGALAGLQADDEIISVDGEPAAQLGFRGVVERIRGEEGSSVRLSIRRGDGAPFELIIARQKLVFSTP